MTMGFNFGSSSQKSSSSSSSGPWGPQRPYIEKAFSEADRIYGDQQNQQNPYQGLQTPKQALPNQWQLQGAQAGANYAGGAMQDPYALARGYNNIAERENSQYNMYADMAQGLYNRGVGDIVKDAGTVATSPYMENAINSSWDNARRSFDMALNGAGGINHNASRSGNLNSSRAGIAEGLAEAESVRQGMEAENAMRLGAYNKGMDVSLAERGMDQGVMGSLRRDPSRADVEGLLSNDARMGNMAGLMSGSGDYQQQLESAPLQNIWDFYTQSQQDPWAGLNSYYGIVGGNNWGQEATSKSRGSGSSQGFNFSL
jgi:hypothetical protein